MKNKKRILILGASGFIGQALAEKFILEDYDVVGGVRNKDNNFPFEQVFFDIDKLENFPFQILSKIDIIINACGLIGFKPCESFPARAYKYNVELVEIFINKIQLQFSHIKWIQLSTNVVLGKIDQPATEEFKCNPKNVYGKTKLTAEQIVAKSNLPHIIIRTCDVYGKYAYVSKRERFRDFVINSAKNEKEVTFPKEIISNPIKIYDFCDALFFLIQTQFEGYINIAGEKALTRYEFAQSIAKKHSLSIKNFLSTSFDESTRKLFNNYNVLDINKLKSLGFKLNEPFTK